MVARDDEQLHPSEFGRYLLADDARQLLLGSRQRGDGDRSESDDDFGLCPLQLVRQMGEAALDLVVLGPAVRWRAAPDDVSYEDLLAVSSPFFKNRAKEFSGPADEGAAGLVLSRSGSLPDERDCGPGRALTVDDFPPATAERASIAFRDRWTTTRLYQLLRLEERDHLEAVLRQKLLRALLPVDDRHDLPRDGPLRPQGVGDPHCRRACRRDVLYH